MVVAFSVIWARTLLELPALTCVGRQRRRRQQQQHGKWTQNANRLLHYRCSRTGECVCVCVCMYGCVCVCTSLYYTVLSAHMQMICVVSTAWGSSERITHAYAAKIASTPVSWQFTLALRRRVCVCVSGSYAVEHAICMFEWVGGWHSCNQCFKTMCAILRENLSPPGKTAVPSISYLDFVAQQMAVVMLRKWRLPTHPAGRQIQHARLHIVRRRRRNCEFVFVCVCVNKKKLDCFLCCR